MISFYETPSKVAHMRNTNKSDYSRHCLILLFALIAETFSPQATICFAQSRAEQDFRQAARLFNAKKGLQARDILTRMAKDPRAHPKVLCLLADTYMAEEADIKPEHLKLAREYAQRAIKMDPEWGNAWKILAQTDNEEEKYAEALTLANRALSVKKMDPRAYLQRTFAYQGLKRPEDALKDITIYTDKYVPRESDMHNLKGQILCALKRYDDAIAAFRTSQKIAYSDWTAHRIIEQLEILGRHQEALAEANNLILHCPKDADSYQIRAQIYGKLNQTIPAINDYTKAISLEPAPNYYKQRAVLLKKIGKTREAEADLKHAETTRDFGF